MFNKKMQYVIKSVPTDDKQALEDLLNNMSEQGWDLYTMHEIEGESSIDFNCMFVREKQEEELNNLITGKDALNEAINTMRENIDYLNVLEEQAMMRYPELIRDSEYLHYLNSLKHKLNANYQRLTRRQNTIDKLIVRSKKNIKVLKRKKNKYYKNAA
jgi:uncharacterized protein YdcH (DUF465 family)